MLTVLNHKWNDFLRKKYRRPIIGIGEDMDIVDEESAFDEFEKNEEAEQIRKAVAFLGKIHREDVSLTIISAIIRH